MRPLVRIALAVLLVTASCGGGSEGHGERPGRARHIPRPGHALEEIKGSRWAIPPRVAYAPGQELVFMVVPLRNISDSPLVIRRVVPVGLVGSPRVARVVAIDLAPRRRGIRSIVPLGPYQTYPPASNSFGECAVQRVVRAAGYALEPSRDPSDRVLLTIRIRMNAPGTFALRGERVFYEQDGKRYHQDLPFALRIAVRKGRGQPLREDERPCAHLTRMLRHAERAARRPQAATRVSGKESARPPAPPGRTERCGDDAASRVNEGRC